MPIQVGSVISGGVTATIDRGRTAFTFDTPALSELAQGTSTSQADMVFSDTRTLATNTSESLDLAGGVANVFGVTQTFAKVKALRIKSAAANTTNLTVGNVTNGFVGPFGVATGYLVIPPGGEILLTAPVAGWTVTASTGDLLKVANAAGASADYDIDIVGTSA
jgi:hypothetical protein